VPTVAPTSQGLKPPVNSGVAWTPDRDLEHPEWVQWGRRLGAMSRMSNWLIGDWLQYGARKWGEKYAEAARITGHDVKTLRNIAYVARSFDLSRRRDKLTWSHHAELAVFDEQEQDHWLDRAIEDRLSVADLRIELRHSQRRQKDGPGDGGEQDHAQDNNSFVICPQCGGTIPLGQGPDPDRGSAGLDP
jgi:hypothetical protein